MDLKQIGLILDELHEDKGISKEKIVETIEQALAAAYKREYGERGQIIHATFSLETGKTSFKQIKIVVDESLIKTAEELAAEALERDNAETKKPERHQRQEEESVTGEDGELKKVRFIEERHIMLEDAIKIKKDAKLGDEIEFDLPAKEEHGRIAAQTAKQVIIQRMREAERDAVWEEYSDKEGEIISGLVQRVDGRNVFVDLGRTTAILPHEEQVPGEHYRIGERLKALLLSAEQGTRGPGLYLSRSHPNFVVKLFELEVPEISQEIVEIKRIAREAGSRSKVAVDTTEDGIDPVGSLVGQKGVRVGAVITELGGEKIDIIEWSENPEIFIGNALSPARVLSADINEASQTATVIVDETQLSLAIGRGGQNVRLAAKLTGWKIDVQSEGGEPVASATEDGEVETNEHKDLSADDTEKDETTTPEASDETNTTEEVNETEDKDTETA